MLPHAKALKIILDQTFEWGTVRTPLQKAAGKILWETITADRPQPPFDRVTMDGIAIDHSTYANGQRFFPVEKLQAAGVAPSPLTDPAKCVEIMTGAALPPEVSTVIRYEDLEKQGDGFLLPEGIEDQKNIHFTGSDTTAGAVLMKPGRRIGVAEIGMLATFGYSEIEVRQHPRVAIVSTGDELVAVREAPLPHQIRRSNVHQLAYLLQEMGIEAELHHLPDAPEKMRPALATILQQNDILLLSGGVSKGKLDFVPDILADLGVEKLFHRVAQRPGKPLWAGRTRQTMVFGLPGNPVSTLAGALVYVQPFIRQNLKMTLVSDTFARLAEDYSFKPALTLFQLVTVHNEEGTLQARPVKNAGSGDATSLLRADGLLVLPAARSHFSAGEIFKFIPFLW